MTKSEYPAGENWRHLFRLAFVVAVGAVGVALVWSALNELGRNSLTLVDGVTGTFGAVTMLALVVWLWRYLSALLPESQRSHRHITRRQPPHAEENT